MKKSLKLFTDAFENSLVGMVILDNESNIKHSNLTFRKMINLNESSDEGSIVDYIYPEDVEEYKNKFNDLLDNKINGFKVEIRYLSNKSKVKWWNIKVTATAEFDNSNLVIFALLDDMTQQKEQANKLRDEKNIAERTTKIKSDFLAHMSHEIRTPIHTIIGMNELLAETTLDPEQLEYVEQIRFSADVLISLINDILDFSKIESGNLVLENINFKLYDLIEEAVNLVVLQAHKKGIEVCVNIEKDVHDNVLGDPVRLRQIITNLFNNSVKFTKEGEIVISVELLEKKNNNCMIKISVKDTGIGIPKDKINKIFKAFSQVDSSTTRMYGGTGLGLSISKSLVNLMDGKISVNSIEGEGSEFWFTVKLVNNESKDIEENKQGDLKIKLLDILLVDDNDTARNILKKQIENYGCKVTAISNGADAVKIMEEAYSNDSCFDACLIDLLMPGMDGWQLASEINNNKKICNAKLFLMSPWGKSADEAKMKLLSWFKGYISKPVKHNDIYNLLIKVSDPDFYSDNIEELDTYDEQAISKLTDKKKKILVSEDHEVNQRLFKTILESMGYEVKVVDNGIDSVKYAEEDMDLIFMDINMPGMNGYEASKKIREKGIKTPIIAVTANALKGEKDKCLKSGMDDFLTKPFRKEDIEKIFDKWLNKKDNVYLETEGSEKNMNIDKSVIFDFEKAVNNFMGNKEVVIELINVFINKTENQLNLIESALKERKLEIIAEEAHSMKGGALSLEIKKTGESAKLLEESAKSGAIDETVNIFNELKNDYNNFKMIAKDIVGDNS